jgi:dTDP-4-amino-4,6-dideoxygalactose transaminase
MKKIEFFKHCIDDRDIERVNSVLRSIFLTTGKEVEEFETSFSEYLRIKYTVGLTSCTAALHLSLLALGIGPGDEVITTPMSFCATSNAVLHAGAKPVFVDVEEETGNINAELVEGAITGRTRAIIPVHLYGQMCDMKRLSSIAEKHNLIIIEDAAHAIEAVRDDIGPGDASSAACFSFYATKNITSGEGGAVCTNNTETAESLRRLRLHGIDKSAIDRYTNKYQHWDMPVLGWKYNMDNIHAALLIGQVARLDELRQKREHLWTLYEKELSGVRGVEILKTVKNSRHARHLFTVLVGPRQRDAVLWSLQERGIGVAVNYRPIHLLKYYRDTFGHHEGDFPVAEDLGLRTISLPLFPGLENDEAQRVIKTIREVIHG